MWDTNGDGVISKLEFGEALTALSLIAETKDAEVLFETIDVDGSGKITLNELEYMLKQRPPSPPSYTACSRQRVLRHPPDTPRRPAMEVNVPPPPPIEKRAPSVAVPDVPLVKPIPRAARKGLQLPQLSLSPRLAVTPRSPPAVVMAKAIPDADWFRDALFAGRLPPSPRAAALPALAAAAGAKSPPRRLSFVEVIDDDDLAADFGFSSEVHRERANSRAEWRASAAMEALARSA
jgi:hypothetical protein